MGYFLDSKNRVHVTIGQDRPKNVGDVTQIPADASKELHLRHQQVVDDATANELRGVTNSPLMRTTSKWEYRVKVISEAAGLGTAEGAGERISQALAAEGPTWELHRTIARESRWIGGETVLLVLRRSVITEADYAARFEQEERIRRTVIARLDSEP